MPIRIGVNALYLKPGGVGGTEIYLRSLLAAMARIDQSNEWIVFANSATGPDLVPTAPNFTWSPQPVSPAFRPGRILYEQLVLPWRAREINVLFNPGFTAPILFLPNVTVFHDLQHKRHPEHFRWFDLPFWNLLLWSSARRSRRLISVSQPTHDDLLKFYGVDSTIILHGVDPRYFEIGEHRQPEPFLLCVSTLHPHKNHVRLLRAFASFKRTHPEYALVLAGMRGFAADEVAAEIARLQLGGAVRVTGWIEEAELFDLYARAAGVVYPSTFEGFGLPVLEAMAAQVPLASSNIEPLHGLTGGCAIEFEAFSEASIALALERLVTSPMPLAPALKRARQFSWEQAARQTLDILAAATQ